MTADEPMSTPDSGGLPIVCLTDAEMSHAQVDPSAYWRGRWYSESAVEGIIARRIARRIAEPVPTPDSEGSIEYVVGFAFDTDGRVALIRKNRPEWQAGRLNGIGGHVEPGEHPNNAMWREFHEETGTSLSGWMKFVVMDFPGARIHFYRLIGLDPRVLDGLRSMTDEEVVVAWPGDANQHLMIPNLTWLIPLAAYTADTYEQVHVRAAMAEAPTPDSADDATVGEHEPTHIYVYGSDGQPEVATVCDECSEDWPCTSATSPADDANRAPVSGGLDEGERSWGITRSNGATVYAEHDVERILAARDAAWVERLAAVEGERDHWKEHAEEAGRGFERVCLDYARVSAARRAAEAERDTARREAGERIAQAIEALSVLDDDMRRRDAETMRSRAARIARADALTSDDGSGA